MRRFNDIARAQLHEFSRCGDPSSGRYQRQEKAWVHPRLWYPDTGEGGRSGWKDSERLLFEQPDRVDAAAARLRSGDPDRPSVFFVGFAGTGEQKVFAEETMLAERVISERYGAAGRTLLLVNDRRDLETWPLATVHGLRRALGRLAERMDRSKDVLFLFLTSHGSPKHLAVSNSIWPLEQLDPAAVRKALDASGIRWRVIVSLRIGSVQSSGAPREGDTPERPSRGSSSPPRVVGEKPPIA